MSVIEDELPVEIDDSNEGPICFDPLLRMLASSVDDLEQVRKATENRFRSATRDEPDEDGIQRGLGLSPEDPFVANLAALLLALKAKEVLAVKQLEKAMKKHPLGSWVMDTPGVGLKQGARLLAAIGDPYWHMRENRPRSVSELWAYSGYHTVPLPDAETNDTHAVSMAARRKKGVKSNWSSEAKTRAYLISTSCLKAVGSDVRARSPYRDVYDARKERVRALHPEWSDGHCHNDALRITSKRILQDLWREAKRLHEEANEDPTPN